MHPWVQGEPATLHFVAVARWLSRARDRAHRVVDHVSGDDVLEPSPEAAHRLHRRLPDAFVRSL
ncbi:MAG: hypothetical protein AVDCRST_MAG07-914 [uncultured Frankineae bacterium]|uniref:Uncharacterized protein n=1 Tax=uncultured Frankineae bacterium TaxID=437475 RepID=A0A6J4KUR9_9ACTN|nr:MAG: hypothetical protein AVDCRST_MAG07-914 [uncultured Frankineae bacterium]